MQNQVEFYRQRGFRTVFLIVPFHRMYMESSPIWKELNDGISDLGADQLVVAALRPKRYNVAKYTTTLRFAFSGTVLDWMVGVGRWASLPTDLVQSLRQAPPILLHVNHVYTLGFALRLRRTLKSWQTRLPVILETHDAQSQVLLEKHEMNPWTHKVDRVDRLIHSEISLARKADVLVHLSVNDFEFFHKHLPSKPHVLAMPTIDESFVSSVNTGTTSIDKIDLLFVGQSHRPNLEALQWFFAEVWPRLANRHYQLKIVGLIEIFVREFVPDVYEEFRACFTGEVADLVPYYQASRCVVAPMVSGTGISIKTIEALALGKPFVGTSKAYRGMPMDKIEEAGLRPNDTPKAFANAVVNALANQTEAGSISRSAYDLIFSKKAAYRSREEAFDLAMNKARVQI